MNEMVSFFTGLFQDARGTDVKPDDQIRSLSQNFLSNKRNEHFVLALLRLAKPRPHPEIDVKLRAHVVGYDVRSSHWLPGCQGPTASSSAARRSLMPASIDCFRLAYERFPADMILNQLNKSPSFTCNA